MSSVTEMSPSMSPAAVRQYSAMRSSMKRRRDLRALGTGGFTLIELLVVVAILGVLTSLSITMMSTKPKIEETANLLALRISDAAREARSAGPVPVPNGSPPILDRAKLVIDVDGAGNQYFAVELRMLASSGLYEYAEVTRSYARRDTTVAGYDLAHLAQTDVGNTSTALPVPYELLCSPSSGCGPDTLYLKTTDAAATKFRVIVMPLATLPLTLPGW